MADFMVQALYSQVHVAYSLLCS